VPWLQTVLTRRAFGKQKPEDRAIQFELVPNFLEPEDGIEVPVDPIRVLRGGVLLAHFVPFRVQSTA